MPVGPLKINGSAYWSPVESSSKIPNSIIPSHSDQFSVTADNGFENSNNNIRRKKK